MKDIMKLNHNDKIIINGKRGRVFTVSGYAKQYNENPMEAVYMAIKNGHILYCINQEPTMLTDDKEYNKKRNKEWENAVVIEDGDIVNLEGDLFVVDYKGNYADMVHFIKYYR